MGKKVFLFLIFLFASNLVFGQFGKNKIQYKNFSWYYIQTKHFDIYFPQGGEKIAEFAAKSIEDALTSVQKTFNYTINNRISFIIYKSTNDFQETNVTDEYLEEGIGGFTEIFKNRIVLPFDGSYSHFRHVIHHELTHGVVNDMFYGGSLQNVISKGISIQLPLWFNEGLAEYESVGWDTDEDMFIRDAVINDNMPDINRLNGYYAYRGGQAVFNYIARKYGREKIGEIINKTKGQGDLEEGLKSSIGLTTEELNERWKKDLKKTYWPDIATHDDPDVFAKRLTNHKKEGGNYNTSPAISPQGDKVAFISNRNFYFDVYLMNLIDGKIIKKLVEGNRSPDFEQLNILSPGLDWSPDGKKIVLSAKTSGWDVIYIIDVESEDKEELPIRMDGISSVNWSPDGQFLSFIGQNGIQSDVFIYDLWKKELTNLTNDVFTDLDPVWSPDNKIIYFASDRSNYLNPQALPDTFNIANFNNNRTHIYGINLDKKNIFRVTNFPYGDEISPAVSQDGKEILFIGELNGINNIFKQRVYLTDKDSVKSIDQLPSTPITNSLNGLYQLSLSNDGKKLVFSSLYESAYNIFLLNNPFEPKTDKLQLEPTVYYSQSILPKEEIKDTLKSFVEISKTKNTNVVDTSKTEVATSPSIFVGNIEEAPKADTTKKKVDYSKYIFSDNKQIKRDSTTAENNPEFNPANNLDSKGNYLVNKYKIDFSPDIIYANAGYSTLYGLLGTTVLSFSDMLGNHRIIGITSLQIDLKNSDYGLAYYYLPNRVDFGIEGFHTARFVYLQRGQNWNLFRFRNYGMVLSASYPLNKFYRVDGGVSWLNISSENLDDVSEPSEKVGYLIPSLSFIHDNVLWGYTSPIDGTRYNLTLFGNPVSGSEHQSFYSLNWDYRNYSRFWYDNSFVFRISGGYSGGENPQNFFIGGTENWINRNFKTGEIPLNKASDFAFLTPALPLRGYDYAEQIGHKYALLNLELRMPLIRYLVTGPIPILFQNILGVAFIDMGSAWNDTKKLQLIAKVNDKMMTKDMLLGTGFGARMYFLYFLLRFDVAWSYNLDSFSRPKYYFSIGADF
ncbi:MAG: biopolymer transporter Tol [Ignavibacteriales bacterium]|nr:biopolymer transporter Tol [Ignavibacteriales bacterium]